MFRASAPAVVSIFRDETTGEGYISVRLSLNTYVLTVPCLICRKGLEGEGFSAGEERRGIGRIISEVLLAK